MHELQFLIIAVIILALVFDFINGFHDTANAIATSVSTRALKPRTAIIMAAFLNFFGAMYSTGVAKTIGGDIVKSAEHIDEHIIVAALIGAIVWNLFTWWIAMPSSSSHALVGGIIGAVLVSTGAIGLNFWGIGKIVLSLILSPIIAIVVGFIIMNIFYLLFGKFRPSSLNNKFKRMQIITAATMAFSHGSNDAQKSMGIITLALLSGGYIDVFEVPYYVKILAATAMWYCYWWLENHQNCRWSYLQTPANIWFCCRFKLFCHNFLCYITFFTSKYYTCRFWFYNGYR